MNNKLLERIYNFHCPRWNELPSEPKFNKEVVDYINDILDPLMVNEKAITTTMVQNYIKWEFIPKPEGRKYNKTQIAYLIVISIYKQILNIKDVKKGVDLQLRFMDVENAYNNFSIALDTALERSFKSIVLNNEFRLEEFFNTPETAGIDIIAHAFSLKLLVTLIISNNGFQGLGGENIE